jgi:hypothetical protein
MCCRIAIPDLGARLDVGKRRGEKMRGELGLGSKSSPRMRICALAVEHPLSVQYWYAKFNSPRFSTCRLGRKAADVRAFTEQQRFIFLFCC